MTNALIYLRVSTDEQDQGDNLLHQERVCRNYAQAKNINIVRVFTDAGKSGRTAARPSFQQMLSFCRKSRGTVSLVIVQDLSRFAGNVADQANAFEFLVSCNVGLYSVQEGAVECSATGKLRAAMQGSFNQYFSDSLSERQKERTRLAAQSGADDVESTPWLLEHWSKKWGERRYRCGYRTLHSYGI